MLERYMGHYSSQLRVHVNVYVHTDVQVYTTVKSRREKINWSIGLQNTDAVHVRYSSNVFRAIVAGISSWINQ